MIDMAAIAERRAPAGTSALALTAVSLNLAITLPLAFILNVWQDDAYTLHSSAAGIGYAIRESIIFEQSAPLYFVVITLWRELSQSAVFARLFSVFCIAVTVALLPALAERYLPRRDCRWLVMTIAVNPFMVWAAVEIRAYALIILFSVLLLLGFYDGFLHDPAGRRARAAYALCAAAALYTQYYFAFTIAALGLYLLIEKRRALLPFIGWTIPAIAAFSPILAVVRAQVKGYRNGFIPPHSPLDAARMLIGSLDRYVLPLDFLAHPTRVYIAVMAIAVIAAAALILRRRIHRGGDGIMLAITGLACAVFSAGLYAGHVVLLERHAASLMIPAAFSIVAALTFLPGRAQIRATNAWYVLVTLLSVASLIATYKSGAKPGDWARVAAYIESLERPGEPIAVFQAENTLPFGYYYRGPNRAIAVPHPLDFTSYDVTKFIVRSPADIARVLPHGAGRLWWIDAGECKSVNIEFGCAIVQSYIAQHYRVVSDAAFYQSEVRLLEPLRASAGAHYANCPVFTSGDYYNKPVAGEPVDAHSAQYIDSMAGAGNTGPFLAEANPKRYVNLASAATPLYTVHPKVPYHRFAEQYPWNVRFKIEPFSDAHGLVVATATCRLYETYETSFDGATLSAYSGAVWDLRKPFVPLAPGTPSAMASGLSLFAGMVKFEEVRSGRIDHALNWAAPANTVSQFEFVRPASDTDWLAYKGSGSYQLPYGARLRLKRTVDISRFGPQSKAIAQALETYGMFLADTAHENTLYTAAPLDGSGGWDASDLASLERLRITDFDVVDVGQVQRVPGH